MKKQTLRARWISGVLALGLATAGAQVTRTGGGVTVNPVTANPGATPLPGRAMPVNSGGVQQARPNMRPAGNQTIIMPSQPIVVMPGYPSGWIGPTIIRETHGPTAPVTPSSTTSTASIPRREGQPTLADGRPPPHRLVAVLGQMKRHDATKGGAIEIGKNPLCIATGALVGYENDPSSVPGTHAAMGDFFGSYWDGASRFETHEDWKGGPYLDHPIVTVNEASPSRWELEAAMAGRRMGWMRLAVTLFDYRSPASPDGAAITFPRGRRAAMGDALSRIDWAAHPVQSRTAAVTSTDAYRGEEVTRFGRALAMFAERTMTPSMENDRIGVAEWFFNEDELNGILATCPKFEAEIPSGKRLRELRASERASEPAWVRTFDLRGDHSRCTGEIWFIAVPDVALSAWLDMARRNEAAGKRS